LGRAYEFPTHIWVAPRQGGFLVLSFGKWSVTFIVEPFFFWVEFFWPSPKFSGQFRGVGPAMLGHGDCPQLTAVCQFEPHPVFFRAVLGGFSFFSPPGFAAGENLWVAWEKPPPTQIPGLGAMLFFFFFKGETPFIWGGLFF